jgi:hypothetical protein
MKIQRYVYLSALLAAFMMVSSQGAFAHEAPGLHTHVDGKVIHLAGPSVADHDHDELVNAVSEPLHLEKGGSLEFKAESLTNDRAKAFLKSVSLMIQEPEVDGGVKDYCATCNCNHGSHHSVCQSPCTEPGNHYCNV